MIFFDSEQRLLAHNGETPKSPEMKTEAPTEAMIPAAKVEARVKAANIPVSELRSRRLDVKSALSKIEALDASRQRAVEILSHPDKMKVFEDHYHRMKKASVFNDTQRREYDNSSLYNKQALESMLSKQADNAQREILASLPQEDRSAFEPLVAMSVKAGVFPPTVEAVNKWYEGEAKQRLESGIIPNAELLRNELQSLDSHIASLRPSEITTIKNRQTEQEKRKAGIDQSIKEFESRSDFAALAQQYNKSSAERTSANAKVASLETQLKNWRSGKRRPNGVDDALFVGTPGVVESKVGTALIDAKATRGNASEDMVKNPYSRYLSFKEESDTAGSRAENLAKLAEALRKNQYQWNGLDAGAKGAQYRLDQQTGELYTIGNDNTYSVLDSATADWKDLEELPKHLQGPESIVKR